MNRRYLVSCSPCSYPSSSKNSSDGGLLCKTTSLTFLVLSHQGSHGQQPLLSCRDRFSSNQSYITENITAHLAAVPPLLGRRQCRLRRTQICHSLGERALDLGELRSKGPVAGLRLVAFPAEPTEATTPVESSARASTTSAWRCRDSRSRRPRVAGVGRRRGATLPSVKWRPNLLTTVFPSLYS